MKRADSTGSRPAGNPAPSKPPQNPSAKKPGDARDEGAQLEQNREELGVAEDHRTEAMKKGKRGTFP